MIEMTELRDKITGDMSSLLSKAKERLSADPVEKLKQMREDRGLL